MKHNNNIKQKILERDSHTCQKCGFENKQGMDLELHPITPRAYSGDDSEENLVTLCPICHNYAPDSKEDFLKYLDEKIDGSILNTFRHSQHSISKKTSHGMNTLFEQGKHITKAPRGYKLVDKALVPNQDADQITILFKEFLGTDISLTQLAKKNNMTTAGIKKLLKNTTYIGKVKFANVETDGQHIPIIDKQLFKQVQEKLNGTCRN